MDELLIRRAQQGSPEAFDTLMGDLESLVWRVCWHVTGNREDASDCGQEAMLKIWRNLPSFRFDCAFESWVYRIASNCALDLLRKRKRESLTSLEPLREQGFDPPDPTPGTEERVLQEEEKREIREAIAALPEDQRDALILTQLEKKSYAEAASLLDTTEGTVKSRVNRARAKLKEFLRSKGEPAGSESVKRSETGHASMRSRKGENGHA